MCAYCPFFTFFVVIQNLKESILKPWKRSKLFKALTLLCNYHFKVLAVSLYLQLQLSLDLKLFMKLFLQANLRHQSFNIPCASAVGIELYMLTESYIELHYQLACVAY